MTDPTLTQALSTPCKRCGGMPIEHDGPRVCRIRCAKCNNTVLVWKGLPNNKEREIAARQWVERNKEVEDDRVR